METIKAYKKTDTRSYTMGAFPTFELLNAMPERALAVLIHSDYREKEALETLCRKKNVRVISGDRAMSRVAGKENVFVIGVFEKFETELSRSAPHVVLVNPGDMGNLGTIIRTAVGFDIKDIAIVRPGTDIFNPKSVRASMGAVFRLRHAYFDTYEQYRSIYPEHETFAFMLDGERPLTLGDCPKPKLYALIFGNEAAGLDEKFKSAGTSVYIPQTAEVDSLNITIAAGIGMYMFAGEACAKKYKRI